MLTPTSRRSVITISGRPLAGRPNISRRLAAASARFASATAAFILMLTMPCAFAMSAIDQDASDRETLNEVTGNQAAAGQDEAPIRPVPEHLADRFVLHWHDEFEGDALDMTKWSYRGLGPRRDGVNTREAISLDGNGHLLITTSKSEEDGAYHTGMIGTQGKFETTFGFFETRIKFQSEVGHWSAFWLQTPDMGKHIGNPARAGAEVDIIEYLCNGRNRNEAKHAVHWDGYGEHHQIRTGRQRFSNLHDGFHTFGLLWTPDEYIFYVDDVETWRLSEAVSHRDLYIILSMEVGRWAGDIANADLPDSVTFDYVRVFKPKDGFENDPNREDSDADPEPQADAPPSN